VDSEAFPAEFVGDLSEEQALAAAGLGEEESDALEFHGEEQSFSRFLETRWRSSASRGVLLPNGGRVRPKWVKRGSTILLSSPPVGEDEGLHGVEVGVDVTPPSLHADGVFDADPDEVLRQGAEGVQKATRARFSGARRARPARSVTTATKRSTSKPGSRSSRA